MTNIKRQTYDFICFTDLAYEFEVSDEKETEKKIKRRLKYHKLGGYNQERVSYIRQLKNDLRSEISSGVKSKYFINSKSKYADLNDFDFDSMVLDYVKKYDKIDKNEMEGIINFAIYLYHLR